MAQGKNAKGRADCVNEEMNEKYGSLQRPLETLLAFEEKQMQEERDRVVEGADFYSIDVKNLKLQKPKEEPSAQDVKDYLEMVTGQKPKEAHELVLEQISRRMEQVYKKLETVEFKKTFKKLENVEAHLQICLYQMDLVFKKLCNQEDEKEKQVEVMCNRIDELFERIREIERKMDGRDRYD